MAGPPQRLSGTSQLALPVRLRDSATFDTFHSVGQEQLIRQLRSQAEQPLRLQPTWLWGPHGSGRSHLLQALCAAAAQAGWRTAYLPLAELMSLGPELLVGQQVMQVLCVDDLDRVAGERDWALGLFGLHEALCDNGGWLVFSTTLAPSSLQVALPDLRSRLAAAAVHRLRPLDEQGLLDALMARAHRLGLELPEDTGRWLLHRLPRDPASVFAALDALDHAALQAQRRLTIAFARQVFRSVTADVCPSAGGGT